jgi:hypothetical protein
LVKVKESQSGVFRGDNSDKIVILVDVYSENGYPLRRISTPQSEAKLKKHIPITLRGPHENRFLRFRDEMKWTQLDFKGGRKLSGGTPFLYMLSE